MPAAEPNKAEDRAVIKYEIAYTADGWTIFHDGVAEGSLDTKTAAFDSVVAAAVVSLRSGRAVAIRTTSDSQAEGGADETAPARYEITRFPDGWGVVHDGRRETVLDSKMAAFDAAVGAAVASMGSGLATFIRVQAAAEEQSFPQD